MTNDRGPDRPIPRDAAHEFFNHRLRRARADEALLLERWVAHFDRTRVPYVLHETAEGVMLYKHRMLMDSNGQKRGPRWCCSPKGAAAPPPARAGAAPSGEA